MRKNIDTNEISSVVDMMPSLSAAARKLQIPLTSLKRICDRNGIDRNRVKDGFTESMRENRSKTVFKKNIEQLNKILDGDIEYKSTNCSKLRERIISSGLMENKCSECGLESTWNGKQITLHLDHISGNRNDNTRQNLRLLCPNCHSQTDTYAGKNIKLRNRDRFKDLEQKIIDMKPETVSELMRGLGIKPSSFYYKKVNDILIKTKIKCKIRKKCTICDKFISDGASHGLCSVCSHVSQRKAERPSKEFMIELLRTNSIVAISKMYSVSDKAIIKWLVAYGLPTKRKDIKEFISKI